jgi:TonB family protein
MKVKSIKLRLGVSAGIHPCITLIILLLASASSSYAQQLGSTTLTLGPDQLGVIKTASKFSTRISFREPVREVICGDLYDPVKGTGSFVIQQIDNEVYIKPIATKGMSNMFVKIGTRENRTFNFDLVIVPPKEANFIVNILSPPAPLNVAHNNAAANASQPVTRAPAPRSRLLIPPTLEIHPVGFSIVKEPGARTLPDARAALFISTKELADPPPLPPVAKPKQSPVLGNPIQRLKPEYPKAAEIFEVYGEVVVSIEVDEKGKVESAEVVSGHSTLRGAALYAARNWRYAPLQPGEPPMKRTGIITFNFRKSGQE